MAIEFNELKCPACGGKLEFDPVRGMSSCLSCGNKQIINEHNSIDELSQDDKLSICPNCGSRLRFDPIMQVATCDACDSIFNILQRQHEDDFEAPSHIIPISVSENEYKQEFYNFLHDEETIPDDIFEEISIKILKGIYIPFYYIAGRFNITYTCDIGYKRQETYYENGEKKTRTVTDWNAFQGTMTDDWIIPPQMATTAFEKYKDIPIYKKNAKQKKKNLEYSSIESFFSANAFDSETHEYDDNYVAGFGVLPVEISEEEVYNDKYGLVKGVIHSKIVRQLPGDQYRNVNWSGQVEKDRQQFCFLSPYWITEYSYNNEDYIDIVDGTNIQAHCGTSPADEQKVEEHKKIMLPQKVILVIEEIA